MRKHLAGGIALALACVMLGTGIGVSIQQNNAYAEENTVVLTSPFTAAVKQVRSSVVGVSNYQKVRYGVYGNGFNFGFGFGYGYGYGDGYDQEPETREELASTGSGVVVGKGFVLTNYHVVEDASSLKVTVNDDNGDSQEYNASLVAYDETMDIAIVYAPKLPLSPVKLGDSDQLQVGDWAICIGNPLGFTNTVTTGTVSALNRAVESDSYDKYGRKETITNAMIQVDAAINSGNSGGGMFSVTGELMGIPTLKYTGSYYSGSMVEGIGMCIPINVAKPLIDDVLSGRIKAEAPAEDEETDDEVSISSPLDGKPRMGITIADDLNTSLIRQGLLPRGVHVRGVDEDGPAAEAGMLVDDIIVEVDETVVTSTTALQNVLKDRKAGETVSVKVFRVPEGLSGSISVSDLEKGEYVTLNVKLAVVDTDVVKQ